MWRILYLFVHVDMILKCTLVQYNQTFFLTQGDYVTCVPINSI